MRALSLQGSPEAAMRVVEALADASDDRRHPVADLAEGICPTCEEAPRTLRGDLRVATLAIVIEDNNKLRAEVASLRALADAAEAYHVDCGHDEEGAAAQCDAICEAWKAWRAALSGPGEDGSPKRKCRPGAWGGGGCLAHEGHEIGEDGLCIEGRAALRVSGGAT